MRIEQLVAKMRSNFQARPATELTASELQQVRKQLLSKLYQQPATTAEDWVFSRAAFSSVALAGLVLCTSMYLPNGTNDTYLAGLLLGDEPSWLTVIDDL